MQKKTNETCSDQPLGKPIKTLHANPRAIAVTCGMPCSKGLFLVFFVALLEDVVVYFKLNGNRMNHSNILYSARLAHRIFDQKITRGVEST